MSSDNLISTYVESVGDVNDKKTPLNALSTNLSTLPTNLNALPTNLSALPTNLSALPQKSIIRLSAVKEKIYNLPKRINDKEVLKSIIIELSDIHSFKLNELAQITD